VVSRTEGKTIEELLDREKSDLVVWAEEDPPSTVTPPADQWLAYLMKTVEIALRIRIVSTNSAMTDDHMFLKTNVVAKVREVFWDRPKALRSFAVVPDQNIEFEEDGGEIVVRGHHVKGLIPWARPLATGEEYIVFTFINVDPTWPVGLEMLPTSMWLVKGEHLHWQVQSPGRPAQDLEKMRLSDVLKRLRGI
jgi:hypothetical protein